LWISSLPNISYGVDGEGRTSTVSASSGQNPVTSAAYNTAGQVIGVTYGSADSDAFAFDGNTGRMTQYKYTVNGSSEIGNLTWKPNGSLSVLAITDPFNSADNQTCNYTHDDLRRIASVNCGSAWSQTFTYDPFGNITKNGSITWLPGYNSATNRYTLAGTSYDSNGNLLNDSFHAYSWDSESHPVTIDTIGLTYDAFDRVVEQNQSGTYYQMVYTPMGTKLGLFKGPVIQQLYVQLPGGTTAEYLSWGLSHYRHADWLGSDRLESSASNHSILDNNGYAPFGEPYAQTGNGEISFTGQNKDTVWLQYDFLARQYDPKQGRWLSPDPAGMDAVDPTNPQSWNRYAYVLNNPLGSIDPTGMAYYDDDGSWVGDRDGECGQQNGTTVCWNAGAANGLGEWQAAPQPSERETMADMVPGGRSMLAFDNFARRGLEVLKALSPCGGSPNVSCGVVFPAGGGALEGDLMASRPAWGVTPGGFVNWLKGLQFAGTKLTAEQADAVVAEAKSLGVEVRLDPPHANTRWDVPHLNIGNKGQVHLEVPAGYDNPGVPKGHP
jgi:RHS repeat-associated protein